MEVDAIELHDARVKSTLIDYVTKTMEVQLEFYPNATEDSERRPLSIFFRGVESVSQIVNIANIEKNSFAGNVNYWVPEEHGGTTYIYLTDGCIAIKAEQIHIKVGELQHG